MDEKAKNKEKAKTKRGCWNYLFGTLLLFGLCIAVFLFMMFEGTNRARQARLAPRDCSEEPEAVEWTGVVDFVNGLASELIITEENAASLVPLGTSQLSDLPSRLGEPIKHPQHDYILALTIYDSGSWDITNDLTVCQQDGWSSHILSDYARSMAFTPDGELFGVDYNRRYNQSIILYDAFDIEEIGRLPLGDVSVKGFAFHPTEALIAILVDGLEDPSSLQIWNYRTLERIANYPLDSQIDDYGAIVFNRDGSLLAIRAYDSEETTIAWGIAPD